MVLEVPNITKTHELNSLNVDQLMGFIVKAGEEKQELITFLEQKQKDLSKLKKSLETEYQVSAKEINHSYESAKTKARGEIEKRYEEELTDQRSTVFELTARLEEQNAILDDVEQHKKLKRVLPFLILVCSFVGMPSINYFITGTEITTFTGLFLVLFLAIIISKIPNWRTKKAIKASKRVPAEIQKIQDRLNKSNKELSELESEINKEVELNERVQSISKDNCEWQDNQRKELQKKFDEMGNDVMKEVEIKQSKLVLLSLIPEKYRNFDFFQYSFDGLNTGLIRDWRECLVTFDELRSRQEEQMKNEKHRSQLAAENARVNEQVLYQQQLQTQAAQVAAQAQQDAAQAQQDAAFWAQEAAASAQFKETMIANEITWRQIDRMNS